MAFVDERRNHRDHLGDMLRRPRLCRRLQTTKCVDIFAVLFPRRLGDLADRLVERQVGIILRRAQNDLVVNVGDVADIGDVVRPVEMAKQAEEHVEDDDRPRVADMGKIVDRRPADVHAHVLGIEGDKVLLLPCQRVVEPKSHRPRPSAARSAQTLPMAGTFRRIERTSRTAPASEC